MQENHHSDSFSTRRPTTPGVILLLVVVAACIGFSLIQRVLLDFRAGHIDEYDYLFVGKTLLQGLDWPTHTYIFGADFNWYLFGLADQWFGGLTGARAAAAILGLTSLAGVYLLAIALWQSRPIALCATLLLAVHSSHIFVSKIATYDAVSLALFSIALAPMVHGVGLSRNRPNEAMKLLLIAASSVLFLFAVLAKYTTLLYLPLIACALLICSARAFFIFIVTIGTGLAAYAVVHWTDLKVLYDVQITGVHRPNATYTDIIIRTLNQVWLLLFPSLAALIVFIVKPQTRARRSGYILCGLLVFSLPYFGYHLYSQNLISLYKHLNTANLFLSLSTAWLCVRISQFQTNRFSHHAHGRHVLLATFMAAYLMVNMKQLHETQRGYPDVSQLVTHIEVYDINGRVLSEDPYLFRYLKFGHLAQDHIKETTWLDNDLDGKHTPQDVKDAVWDRKFDYILLTDAIHPENNKVLREILDQRGYSLQYNERYAISATMTTNTEGAVSLYKREQLASNNEQ